MRLITLDTETTGMCRKRGNGVSVCDGHRIIEIACVEMIDGVLTGNHFHRYVNPGIRIQPGAVKVHGITDAFLKGKPVFADIVKEFLGFVADSVLVIHNARFDVPFIDQELRLLEDVGALGLRGRVFRVIDTLDIARSRFPGCSNSLDGLCRRYGMEQRDGQHSALVDAIILAKLCILFFYS